MSTLRYLPPWDPANRCPSRQLAGCQTTSPWVLPDLDPSGACRTYPVTDCKMSSSSVYMVWNTGSGG